jgi:putative transposase
MRKSRFTESQIVAILKGGEAGVVLSELTRKHGISRATYFNWQAKYGGVSVSELKRMKVDIRGLIQIAESLRASDRQGLENATYNGGFFDKATALCESMPKPVIAAISGTALAGAFEFALSCDLRIAEDGDYLIGCRRQSLVSFPVPAARKGCHAPSEHQLH